VAGLGDSDTTVRKKVVQTFAKINDERIPLWLGQVLMGDPDSEVRLEAVQAVARKEGDIAGIFLQAATGDSSSAVSEAALGLLR
jgi:HEAT repeat protein